MLQLGPCFSFWSLTLAAIALFHGMSVYCLLTFRDSFAITWDTWEKKTALSQSDLEVKYLTYGQKCSVISWETFILHSWFSCIVIALDLLTFVHFLDSLRSTCSDSSGTGCLCRTCGLACHCLSCLHQESRK